ncbi:MAG: hypothetical protein M1820_008307 [Bogoriella megaspora]|nr:MAG: hypothetical protein M1820_008307 [Bogoriella megaspora]
MIDQIIHYATAFNIALLLLLSYLAYTSTLDFLQSRRVKQLGCIPPERPHYAPGGLDLIWDGISHLWEHKNMQLWQKVYRNWGNKNNPYTVAMKVAGQRIMFTSDPENIKAILATQFNDFGKGEQFQKEWDEFLGHSIFATDGQIWSSSRQLLRPLFIKDRVSDLHCFERHTQSLLSQLPPPGQTVDIADLFFRFTLDAATDFLLGRSVDSLKDPQHAFAEAFSAVQHTQSVISRAGPFNYFVPRKQFRKHLTTLNTFVNQFIEAALRLSPAELEQRSKSDEGYTFLHALANFTRDRTVLRDQLVASLLAGRDTTACTLSWCFYELSTHPSVVAKLRAEILDTVGKHREPSYEDLKDMKYLKHVIDETLRLYPVVPFNVRVCMKDTTLPHGGGVDGNQPVGVLKGTPVGYSTLVMQRREDVYPEEWSVGGKGELHPGRFVPERWDVWTPRSWTYIPFNGGPRICIGQQFALTEMQYTLVRLLQRFERIETRMPEGGPRMRSDIVLQPQEGVKVGLYAAKE